MRANHRTAIASTLSIVGMSFWWPLLRTSITGVMLGEHDLQGFQALRLFGALSLLCVVIVGLVAPSPRNGIVRKILTASMAIASSVTSWTLIFNGGGPLATIVGAVSLSFVFALLPIAWASTLACQNSSQLNRCFPLVISSYIASYALDYLVFIVPGIEAARPVFSIAASTALWIGLEYLAAKPVDTTLSLPNPGPHFHSKSDSERIPSSFLAFLLLFYLINCLVVGFVRTGTFEYHADSFLLSRVSASVVVALLLLLITTFPRQANLEKRSVRAASVLFFLSILLLVGLLVASLFPDEKQVFDIGAGLIAAAASCTSVFLYSFVVITMGQKTNPIRYLTFAFTLPVLANVLIGVFAIPILEAAAGMDSSRFWGMPSLVSGLFLAIIFIALLGILLIKSIRYALIPKTDNRDPEFLLSVTEPREPLQPTGHLETFGLSQRELELVELLLHGHTFKKAAELMRLSEGTVQTYAKKIYRKTGVHSKQELIDLIAQMNEAVHT